MSKLFVHFLNDTQIAALKNAGHDVVSFALSEADKAVAAAKGTDLGKAAVAAITAVEDKNLTGAQKFEEALAALLPEVLKYVTGGGISALIGDVEDFGRQLLQSTFNDVKSTSAGKIASEVLSLLGIK